MREVAPGIFQITGFPPSAINAYLAGEVLVDTGLPGFAPVILEALEGRPLSLVLVTHVHPDHCGSAAAVCTARGVPLACHAGDRDAMEGRAPMQPRSWNRGRWLKAPYPVTRLLEDEEQIGEFRVIHTPGHTDGHVALYRERDRLLIAGDAAMNLRPLFGLHEPIRAFTPDPALNRRSLRRLAELRPETVLVGHGGPLRDGAAFCRWAVGLPG